MNQVDWQKAMSGLLPPKECKKRDKKRKERPPHPNKDTRAQDPLGNYVSYSKVKRRVQGSGAFDARLSEKMTTT